MKHGIFKDVIMDKLRLYGSLVYKWEFKDVDVKYDVVLYEEKLKYWMEVAELYNRQMSHDKLIPVNECINEGMKKANKEMRKQKTTKKGDK